MIKRVPALKTKLVPQLKWNKHRTKTKPSTLDCSQRKYENVKQNTYLEHLSVFILPPLGIDSIVPKKETFSVPQFGQTP